MANRKEPALPRFSPMGSCALLCEAPAPLDLAWHGSSLRDTIEKAGVKVVAMHQTFGQ